MHVNTGSNVALWAGAAFHDQARSWVAAVSHDQGLELDGGMDQPHNRPWSSAIRFGSSDGDLWFKVNGPGTRHESTLVGLLAELVPDLVADVLAVDAERGWTLTRDAGPVLRTTAAPEQLWSRWEGIVQRYAAAQILLGDHVRELLGTGTPEVSPRTMPEQAAALLEQLAAQTPDTGGLTSEQYFDGGAAGVVLVHGARWHPRWWGSKRRAPKMEKDEPKTARTWRPDDPIASGASD